MRTAESLRRSGIGIDAASTVRQAATLMEQSGVGALAVLDRDSLVGIVTDRDLVRRVLATGLAPDARVDGVMSTPVITIDADADINESFGIFRTNAIRRLPVVRDGRFLGMLSIDDLLINTAAQLHDLLRPVTAEVVFSHHDSPVPAPT
jgi:CBS domain-containing protein